MDPVFGAEPEPRVDRGDVIETKAKGPGNKIDS